MKRNEKIEMERNKDIDRHPVSVESQKERERKQRKFNQKNKRWCDNMSSFVVVVVVVVEKKMLDDESNQVPVYKWNENEKKEKIIKKNQKRRMKKSFCWRRLLRRLIRQTHVWHMIFRKHFHVWQQQQQNEFKKESSSFVNWIAEGFKKLCNNNIKTSE